jgi:hypothetical protein
MKQNILLTVIFRLWRLSTRVRHCFLFSVLSSIILNFYLFKYYLQNVNSPKLHSLISILSKNLCSKRFDQELPIFYRDKLKDDILKFENEKEIFYSKMLVEKEKIELQNFELIRREDKLKMGIKDLKTAAGKLFVLT